MPPFCGAAESLIDNVGGPEQPSDMGASKKLTIIEETRSVCACVLCSKSKESLNGGQDAEVRDFVSES